MNYKPFGVSVKDGECYVEILAPRTDGEIYHGKLHLSAPDTGRTFCGASNILFHINSGDLEWVTQADLEGQLCKRCKNSAIKYLNETASKSI